MDHVLKMACSNMIFFVVFIIRVSKLYVQLCECTAFFAALEADCPQRACIFIHTAKNSVSEKDA
jgi:hypothetical protein